jgi:2-polyprenyl-6-methoxyphenol hydroxylase-like FAD-dependent oxidoreductase
MSPVGGVGINLAVADAVAAARLLAPALRAGGPVPVGVLRRVQCRRWWPAALVQTAQRLAHRAVLGPALEATPAPGATGTHAVRAPLGGAGWPAAPTAELPAPLRLLQRFPRLQGVPARLVAIGPLPEHAPAWARRPPDPAGPSGRRRG